MKKKMKAAIFASVASVILVGAALLRKLQRRRRRLPRAPFVNHAAEREEYINSILHGSETYCVNQIRMTPIAFHRLCHILTEGEHVRPTIHMPVTEQVFIFLHIIGHNVRFRVMGSRIYRSTETVHRYFKVVLRGVLKLYRTLIRLRSEDTPQEIRNSRRFYPYFKDCVGAIDGTHVRASVPLEIQGRFRGRKDGTTQNVLAAISFDLKFTYVLAGWEGSAHDSRVLNDAFARPGGFSIPNVMSKGKEKVTSNKQFRWLPPMHETMLRILAQEAAKGNKPSSTFKAGSFALVAKEITAQFGVECHPSYVDNRMRTLRTMWSTIEKLRKKSGFGWDDNLKMITCDAKTYQEEVMAHRKHAEFLNKKIEMYDELALVVGKDTATGGFSKSYIDYENEPDNGDSAEFVADNVEEDVVEKGKNLVESSTTGSGISKSRKRGRAHSTADDSVLTDLSDQLKDIATALKEINRGPIDYTSLYNEVMAMMADGYSEEMLATAFDHLCENEKVYVEVND
nr:uncharacterized protein LOC112025719 [Quercus suber]